MMIHRIHQMSTGLAHKEKVRTAHFLFIRKST